MNPNKIERAIALVDPLGLIGMGAPLDEYCAEAADISRTLKNNFTDTDFLEAFFDTMNGSFGNSIIKLSGTQQTDLLGFLREDTTMKNQLREGSCYRVRRRFGSSFAIKGHTLKGGEVIVCVSKVRADTPKERAHTIFLMVEGKILRDNVTPAWETRYCWFLDEVS